MFVSIIVPVFNGEHTLRACLDSLVAQDFPEGHYEILVVDNGSTDSTPAIIDSYGPRVRGLTETRVRSSYAARNTAIRASHGYILAFTDADCIPDPKWLSLLVAGFADPTVGCVGGEVLALDPSTPAERYGHRRGILRQASSLKATYRPYFVTANVAYRREVFDQIGLFQFGLETGGDVDMCWRLQEQTDWELRLQSDASVLHHHRTGTRELWRQYQRYGRGRTILRALYPDHPRTSYESPVESLRRLFRLARHTG
ncbi:MAG: glycosyltransferase, partial [Chloroflexota bacterium]|nr:glycosyltransferase [Chloroflexota bacterium]